jgi:GTP pyrophosphokinase
MDYYLQLTSALEQSGRNYDVDVIKKAYDFANERHAGQLRRSGEPYILHPVAVAELLIGLGLDNACVCAALLHDVVEDTRTTIGEVRTLFGEETAELVDGVTKLTRLPTSSVEEEQAENLRKMLLAMSKDIRVMIIKLCDRLHNMRTLEYLPDQKQRDKARETMEIYAPIAHRLGMSSFKEELEDLALKYLDPHAYDEILQTLADLDEKNGEFTREITAELKEQLALSGIDRAEIQSRKKSVYGIYRKLFIQGRSMEEIYDIYAIRILVDTVAECYNALGVVHDLYTPIPKRFKDYISTPKPNGYQSLHTVVIGTKGIPFEVQIRTREMDHSAEYGIAAHWKYKDNLKGKQKEETFAWLRQLIENQQDSEAEDFIKNIKVDLFAEDVYVFTPKGDVITLPQGATPIDFAYAIHSGVGNSMVGAKVNGRIVNIDYQLNSGEVVDIITSKTAGGPKRDWMKICKTGTARNKIKQWYKKERREENVQHGRQELERELRVNLLWDDYLQDDVRAELLKRMELSS